jgi:GNAT superfamily N-acetyltransferase
MEIVELDDGEAERLVATLRLGDDRTGAPDEYLDWKRQAQDTIWLVARIDGSDVGAAIGVGGWHEPEGARRHAVVDPASRVSVRGAHCCETARGPWARFQQLLGEVRRLTRERRLGAAPWPQEVGELEVRARPHVDRASNHRCAGWCRHRLGGSSGGCACTSPRASPILTSRDELMPDLETWRRPTRHWRSRDATFVAFVDGEVVGYAKLNPSITRPHVVMHDMTAVRRRWRGQGIAGALKRAEITWAIDNGYARLETENEERNEPIRRLNERHGYVIEPGSITLRGPIDS